MTRRPLLGATLTLALAGCGLDNDAPTTASRSSSLGQCPAPQACGNGKVEPGETCDDGNRAAGDGCGSNCLVERSNKPPAFAVALLHRAFTPRKPIEQNVIDAVTRAVAGGEARHHLIAAFSVAPAGGAAETWQRQGILTDGVIHEGAVIVNLPVGPRDDVAAVLEAHRKLLGADSLSAFEPGDRMAPALHDNQVPEWAFDPQTGLTKVMVSFYRTADAKAVDALARSLHAGREAVLVPDANLRGIEVKAASLQALYASPLVELVDVGPAPPTEVLDAVRDAMRISNAARPDVCLTGRGVRLTTIFEQPGINDPDLRRYDAAGVNIGPRVLSGGTGVADPHAAHVAGILLGNGWMSAASGGAPFQWRGLAPEAEFVDQRFGFNVPGGLRPHVASCSSMPNPVNGNSYAYFDARVRGDADPGHFYPQFLAAGNDGLDYIYGESIGLRGFYGIYDSTKNVVTVGNVFGEDLRWAYSSMGPTWDGRIKPDVVAPGCRMRSPYHHVSFDVDEFRIARLPGVAPTMIWHFDTVGDYQGWQPGAAWVQQIVTPFTQVAAPGGRAVHLGLKPGRPHVEFSRYNAANIGDYFNSNPGMHVGHVNDVIEIRYRYEALDLWNGGNAMLFWQQAGSYHYKTFTVQADGAWHTASIAVGLDPNWAGKKIQVLRLSPFAWNPGAVVSTAPGGGYRGSCGTSMATPAATGAAALLMEQLATSHGVDLDDIGSPSPFDFVAPGPGRPRPSTIKALTVHAARDLARIARSVDDNAPDINAPIEYHKGPDWMSGYGIVDGQEAIRLLTENAAGRLQIVERDVEPSTHVYTVHVAPGDTTPFKVTLAWDDAPQSPAGSQHARKLVNDLDVWAISPSGTRHLPWSMDLPYDPDTCVGCVPPEANGDEVFTAADLHPARQDLRNDRDNVEVVYVETPEPGDWKVFVESHGPPLFWNQRYSVIAGLPPRPADRLAGGKVAFVSDRGGTPQIYTAINDGLGAPPVKLLPDLGVAHRDPELSPDGKLIAFLVHDTPSGGDAVAVHFAAGGAYRYHANSFAPYRSLSNPSWSRDGKELFLSFGDSPTNRGIAAIDVATGTTRVLLAPGAAAPWVPDAPVWAGRDGDGALYLALHATNAACESALFRLPVGGGVLERMWANGFPTLRASYPSVSPDGRGLLFASDDAAMGAPGYRDREVLEMGTREGVTVNWTGAAGDQFGSYAIGGLGEWVAESNTLPGGKRQIELHQHGKKQLLPIGDPGNAWDDYHPTWWVADPNRRPADRDNPVLVCPPAQVFAPEPASPCTHTPPVLAATPGACGLAVSVTVSPSVLVGNGPHTITYTATDRLGHVTTCQTVVQYSCGGGGGGDTH